MTEQQIVRSEASDASPGPDEVWRDEIQARVARYRTRRGRRVEGTYSMRFPFVAPRKRARRCHASRKQNRRSAVEGDGQQLAAEVDVKLFRMRSQRWQVSRERRKKLRCRNDGASSGAAEEERERNAFLSKKWRRSRRPTWCWKPIPNPCLHRWRDPGQTKDHCIPQAGDEQEEIYRLADPVIPEQPRILDVPEELEPFPTTPLLGACSFPPPKVSSAFARSRRVTIPGRRHRPPLLRGTGGLCPGGGSLRRVRRYRVQAAAENRSPPSRWF